MIIVGLGNPGSEYEYTRHNAGRIILQHIALIQKADAWKKDKVLRALKTKIEIAGKNMIAILPETFMNLSGASVLPLIKTVEDVNCMVVMYDDLDLSFGTLRISFDRTAGGHNGVKSIIETLKSQKFIRVRIGIAPVTSDGLIKKPKGEDAVLKFVLNPFKASERTSLEKLASHVLTALNTIENEGLAKAMTAYNGK